MVDSEPFVQKIRYLTIALIVSATLNVAILLLFFYWILREQPPTPYCESKPASNQQMALIDCKEFHDTLVQLSELPFSKLALRLESTQKIENGYSEQDLALASLIAFHHFDIQRALPKNLQPRQKRLLSWKQKSHESAVILTIYPGLTAKQFQLLGSFAKAEKWPFTPKGLFLELQKQKHSGNQIDGDLSDTFLHTPEFWSFESLLKRSGKDVSRQEILDFLLESDWSDLEEFSFQQKQVHDQSDSRRQQLLLDRIAKSSATASILLLKLDWDFAVKKLSDPQVIALLDSLPYPNSDGERFAKEMLVRPRSANVWQKATKWLYQRSGTVLTSHVPMKASAAPLAHVQDKVQSGNKEVAVVVTKPQVPPQQVKAVVSQKNQEKKTYFFYTVQEGDSLWKIARQFNLSIESLKASNQLPSDTLQPGIVLKIENAKSNSRV